MRRILIAGCGVVGCALARRLAARGDAVWGLTRRPQAVPFGVRPLVADLVRPGIASALPSDLDGVVFTPSARRAPEEAAYQALFGDGLGRLMDALSSHPVRRFLFVSSSGVYGDRGGGWVDEETPPAPAHFSVEWLLRAEAMVAQAPFPGVSVRPSGLYGPGRTRLVKAVREGRAFYPPGAPRYLNQIRVEDLAASLEFLFDHPAPQRLYLASDDEPADRREVLAWIAERLGLAGPRESEHFADEAWARGSKRCSNRRLRAEGFTFAYPTYREGYASLLEEQAVPEPPGPSGDES